MALVDAVVDTASKLERLDEPIVERVLKREFRDSVEGAGGALHPTELSLSLGGWPGVGGVDVAMATPGGDRFLVELKWGSGTLYNCAWDALKLGTALAERAGVAAFLLAGAPLGEWEEASPGAELFETDEWETEGFFDHHAANFASWRREVRTRPRELPSRFTTSKLAAAPVEVGGAVWELRLVEISPAPDAVTIAVSEEGVIGSHVADEPRKEAELPGTQPSNRLAEMSGASAPVEGQTAPASREVRTLGEQPRAVVTLPCPRGHLSDYAVNADFELLICPTCSGGRTLLRRRQQDGSFRAWPHLRCTGMKRRTKEQTRGGILADHTDVRLGVQVTYQNLTPPPAEQLLQFGVNSQDGFDGLILRKGDVFSLVSSTTDPAYVVNHSIDAIFALDTLLPKPK